MNEYADLTQAVIRRLDLPLEDDVAIREKCLEIYEHGAAVGFTGFTYYDDTTEFYDLHHHLIWELLGDIAEAQSCTPLEYLVTFYQTLWNGPQLPLSRSASRYTSSYVRFLYDVHRSRSRRRAAQTLWNGQHHVWDEKTFKNYLAWFALEWVAGAVLEDQMPSILASKFEQ
jgi:hypothetical protein